MTVKVEFTRGHRPTTGGKISDKAKRALSQTIKAKALAEFVKGDLASGSTPASEEVANAHRLKIQNIARGYYMATIKGCMDLVEDSGVEAEYETPDKVENTRPEVFRRQSMVRGKEKPFSLRGKVSAALSASVVIQEKGNVYDLVKLSRFKRLTKNGTLGQFSVVTERVGIQTSWTKLRMDYALRSPKSSRFYKKRQDAQSARMDFLVQGQRWLAAAKRLRNKRKLTVVRTDYRTGAVTYQFSIDYPALDPEFDFIRKCFVSARKYGLAYPPIPNAHAASGIVYAEQMRPMLRPFAVAMGKRFRDMLDNLK